jgi:hypothetical protein
MRPHRIALGLGEKREVPHRLVPDAGRPRLQHDLRDLGHLQGAGFVGGVDFQQAE